MKQKLVFIIATSLFLYSCKKANDCEKFIINIIDGNGSMVSIYTKTQFIDVDPNGDCCDFIGNSGNTEFTDAPGNYIGKGRKSCK